MPLQSTCQICGNPLLEPRWRLVGVCNKPKCLHAWTRKLQARRQAEMEVQREQRQRLAVAHLDQEAAHLGIDRPMKILPVVVPANLRRIINLPERRRRAFRDRLMESLGQAATLRASSSSRTSGDEPQTLPVVPPLVFDPLLVRGCATCRGRCCNNGQEHAYQDAPNLEGYMCRHPDQRPRHVLEGYLSHIPNKSYENSCVYHEEGGCVLPHEMRARICNDFYCTELRYFQQQFARGTFQEVIYVAIEETRVVRAEPLKAARGGPP